MKKFVILLLVLSLSSVGIVLADAPLSPTLSNYWIPRDSNLGDPVVATSQTIDEIIEILTQEDGTISLGGVAAVCGFEPRNTEGTIYEKDYELVRNDRHFHVIYTGNVIWIVFITDQDCLCVTQIISRTPNHELIARLMYQIATEDPVDARFFNTDLTYTYWQYTDEVFPIFDGKIDLNRVDPNHALDIGTVNVN